MLSVLLDVILVQVSLQVQDLLGGEIILVRQLDQQLVVIELTSESLCSQCRHECTRYAEDGMLDHLLEEGCGLATEDIVTNGADDIRAEETPAGVAVDLL